MQPTMFRLDSLLAFASCVAARLQRRLARFQVRALRGLREMALCRDRVLATISGAGVLLWGHIDRIRPLLVRGAQSTLSRLGKALVTAAGAVAAVPDRLDIAWRAARRRRRQRPSVPVAPPPPRLGPAREWEMVADALRRDLARVPAIAAIQAHAALKIDAAEHALGRIVADCSKVLGAPLAPARRPARRLAPRSALRVRRQLAAA